MSRLPKELIIVENGGVARMTETRESTAQNPHSAEVKE